MSTQSTDSAKKAFSNNLNRQVAQYSLAAAIAGVGMLALVQPAAGEDVVTRKMIPIPLAPFNGQDSVKISMANNGIDNFSFGLGAGTRNQGPRELVVLPVDLGPDGAHNQIVVGAGGSFYAKALALERGVKIGPAGIPFATFFSSSGALVAGTKVVYAFARLLGHHDSPLTGFGIAGLSRRSISEHMGRWQVFR